MTAFPGRLTLLDPVVPRPPLDRRDAETYHIRKWRRPRTNATTVSRCMNAAQPRDLDSFLASSLHTDRYRPVRPHPIMNYKAPCVHTNSKHKASSYPVSPATTYKTKAPCSETRRGDVVGRRQGNEHRWIQNGELHMYDE